MLSEFCSVSEAEQDDFVGLRIVDGLPHVTFPRGYALPENEKQLRRDVFKLMSAIQKFGGNRDGEKPVLFAGEESSAFPFLSYQFIIKDFLAHGYYTEKEVHYITGQRGKINWKRTIQQQQPQIDNNNIVYLDFTLKTNRINENNLITRIHEYCVYESFSMIGWLFLSSDSLPRRPSLPFNKKLFLAVLRKELYGTFNDNKKKLFQSMINVINQSEENQGLLPRITFGVNRFEYIWEDMVDYVFGENNIEDYFPHAHWHIVSGNGYRVESSELKPDTIAVIQDRVFILDAKYYKFGVTGNPMHLPATDSIQKQITYGEYVVNNNMAEPSKVFNAFLMPFNSGESNMPYKFVSVGTADWKQYSEQTLNYNYVLGILVDTRFLLTQCTKHDFIEINRLCSLIEESLADYRHQV